MFRNIQFLWSVQRVSVYDSWLNMDIAQRETHAQPMPLCPHLTSFLLLPPFSLPFHLLFPSSILPPSSLPPFFPVSSSMKPRKSFLFVWNQGPDVARKWRPDERENISTKLSRFQKLSGVSSIRAVCVCVLHAHIFNGGAKSFREDPVLEWSTCRRVYHYYFLNNSG